MNGRHSNYTKVSIVIPAHNEEGNIEPLTEELAKVIAQMKYGVEVVYVNDGSTDRTEIKMSDAARRYRWVRIVRNRVRQGLTSALTKGFAQARGDIMVFYPADLQFHPRDIPKMVDSIDNGADMVCGKKQGQYGKWLVSGVYNLMTRMLFPKLKVSDMNSVKAFTREVYNEFPTMREGWHRYLAAFAATKDYVVREVPVTLQKRHSGKSKFAGKSRILKGLTDLIAVKFQVSVFGDPMHLFGRTALWFFFLGLLVAGAAFYFRFVEHQGYRPLLYVVILFEMAALVTFVMGIITEALVYLRDSLSEMKTQNQRLLDELARRSGGRGVPAREDSENRYYERSDDRVDDQRDDRRDERRDERPQDRREPRGRGDRPDRPERRDRDAARSDRPDPRRREPREAREPREVKREEPREARPQEVREPREQREPREPRREGRPDDRRGGRNDRRPQRGDRRPGREERPVAPEVIASAPVEEPSQPVDTYQPAPPEYTQEIPNISFEDAPAVDESANEPRELQLDDQPSSNREEGRSFQHRSGRRARRVRPLSSPPASGEANTGSESSGPRQNGADIPERPLSIKVRELPMSGGDEPAENS